MKNNKFKNKSHKMIEEINKNDYKIVNDGRRVNPLKKKLRLSIPTSSRFDRELRFCRSCDILRNKNTLKKKLHTFSIKIKFSSFSVTK